MYHLDRNTRYRHSPLVFSLILQKPSISRWASPFLDGRLLSVIVSCALNKQFFSLFYVHDYRFCLRISNEFLQISHWFIWVIIWIFWFLYLDFKACYSVLSWSRCLLARHIAECFVWLTDVFFFISNISVLLFLRISISLLNSLFILASHLIRCLYPPGIHLKVSLCSLWFLWTYFQ